MFKRDKAVSAFEEDKAKAVFWMILRCLFFSIMSVSFRYVSTDIGPFQVFFLTICARYLFLLPPVLAVQGFKLSTQYFKTYLIRAVLTTLGFAAYIAAMQNISLNEVTAISYTAPLFTSVFALWFLGEKVTLKRILALFVGFVGAMVVIRPDIRPMDLGTNLAVLTAVLWSLGDIVVKVQANTKERIGTQLFWSTSFMILFSLPLAMFEYFSLDRTALPSQNDWVAIMIAGLFILLTNLSFFISSRFSDMGFLMPFSFSKLIFTGVMAYILFNEALTESQVVGALIIIASTVYLVNAEKTFGKKHSRKL